MDFLKRIDWFNHDGVNFGMINDFMRNQFYDRVLSRHVHGQHCTDVGFGTGLLTMLALKHGASHVRAFESDPDRYALGCEIIDRLRLKHCVTLLNERYDHSYDATPITFSETVNGNLWWEGLWHSLPKNSHTKFLPGQYFLELWAVTVPHSFAQGLCVDAMDQRSFQPGIDISSEFVSLINELAQTTMLPLPTLSPGIVNFEREQQTAWGWIPYLRAVQAGEPVASYVAGQWQPDIEQFELRIDTAHWDQCTVLLVPRVGMQQDSDRLYLDTGHWGPGESPILLVNPVGTLVVKHSVINGIITYVMEP